MSERIELHRVTPAAHDHDGPFGLLTNPIVDAHGHQLWTTARPVADDEIQPGLKVTEVGPSYLAVGHQKRLADLLTYSFKRALIVREEIWQAIIDAGLTPDPTIYLWPLSVVPQLGLPTRAEYRILWPMRTYAVASLDRSDVVYYTRSNVVKTIKRWHFAPGAVPQWDLFRTDYDCWLATERLRELIVKRGFSGFGFSELRMA